MKLLLVITAFVFFPCLPVTLGQGSANPLNAKFEELNAFEFVEAIQKSGGVALLPLGVMEKHGPHLPLGTDLIVVRDLSLRAAKKEYAVVFPEYYFGQINEARHQPGTIAYSPELLWTILQETLNELSRNGFKKIILVNGHGGNNGFLNYFLISQMHSPKDYSLILFSPEDDPAFIARRSELIKSEAAGGHAGEIESSMIMAVRPDLIDPGKARLEPGEDLDRLGSLENQTSGFWWYASFPDHYHGDGSQANAALGEMMLEQRATQLARLIRDFRESADLEELQREFYKQAENPLQGH